METEPVRKGWRVLPSLPPTCSREEHRDHGEDLDGVSNASQRVPSRPPRGRYRSRIEISSERYRWEASVEGCGTSQTRTCFVAMAANASAYWRLAGMSYIKYANVCADMVRAALKEPHRTAAKAREQVYYRSAFWKEGKMDKQGACDGNEGETGTLRV